MSSSAVHTTLFPASHDPSLTQTQDTRRVNTPASLAGSAKEFESILLTTWLQSAETSFGSVPTPDGEDDAGEAQIQSFATQQLAKAWTNAGGVGIAHKVAEALASQSTPTAPKPETHTVSR